MFTSISIVPSWIMVGSELPDGRVRLLASDQLTYAELQAEFLRQPIEVDLSPFPGPFTRQDISVTAHVRTFTLVEANTWAEAFTMLFTRWKPEQAPAPAIEGRRQLEGQ